MNETIGIIPRAFRRRGVWVACTLLLRAGLNFLGLAMLLPVLALVLDPGSLEGGGMLARAYDGLGFASQRSFALAVCAAVVGVIVLKSLLGLWLARVERNYIFALYRTLSRRLLVTYHDRGLPFVKASNSAVLARNVNVVCLAFAAGVLKPAAAIAAEAMLLVLLFGALMWYTPLAALLALAVFLPSIWLYYGLVRNRINRYGELENKAQREKARLVAETFRGYADIEINNAFPMMLRQFDRAMDQVIRTRLRETAIGLLPQTFTEVGHGPARGSEPRRRRRAGANAVRRIRRGRTAPDALGAQHHDRLDGHQIQPLHDRHPARRRSGLPPGAGYPESGESGRTEHPGLRGHRPGLRENPGGKPSSRHLDKCPGTAQHPGTT